MDLTKTMLASSIAIALGTASLPAQASLTTSATLSFTLGSTTDPDCPLCKYHVSDIYASYFAMDTNANGVEASEKTPIGSFNGIHLGTAQAASGSHTGGINGTETANIDNPWTFFGGTGMHQTTSPITHLGGGVMDFSGWNVTWNGITSIPVVDLGTTIVCDTATCSDSSNYTIDGAFHVAGAGFTTVGYFLHLEGTVSSFVVDNFVPVPAAAWLFGSGLAGLASIARRRKANRT